MNCTFTYVVMLHFLLQRPSTPIMASEEKNTSVAHSVRVLDGGVCQAKSGPRISD